MISDTANFASVFVAVAAEPITFLASPHKRIFWLYLLSSAFIAIVVMWIKKDSLRLVVQKVVTPRLWLHRSSLHDFQWLFFNHALRVFLVVPILGGSLSLAIIINRWLLQTFGPGNFWLLPEIWVSLAFTVVLFLAEDFSRFLTHYAFHKIPHLWRFHAVHHSAEILTPVTLYRIHWLEMMVSSVRGLVVLASVSAVFMYCLDNPIGLIDILGVSVFHFFFNMLGANLRHSHVWLGFGKFEKWLVSPAQHQIHHSVDAAHIDKNFGATLAIWDRMFGSWLASKRQEVTHFGLVAKQAETLQSLPENFWGQCYKNIYYKNKS